MKKTALKLLLLWIIVMTPVAMLTGCHQESTQDDATLQSQEIPLETAWENGKQTVPNLRVVAEEDNWILLEQEGGTFEQNCRFLLSLSNDIWAGTWKDQNGVAADPGQFAVNAKCTLVLQENQQLQQPAIYNLGSGIVSYLYYMDGNVIDGLYLEGENSQEAIYPFADYREKVVSGEMLIDGLTLTYQPLSQQQLDKTISFLEEISAFPQLTPKESQNFLGSESSLRLTFSDGSQVLMTIPNGALGDWQIACQQEGGNRYYWVRSPYLAALQDWITTLSSQLREEQNG